MSERALIIHEHEHETAGAGAQLYAAPYSAKSLTTGPGDGPDHYMTLQPSRGGWIVASRGVYCGFVRKLRSGWKIEPLGVTHVGRAYECCKRATELLDAHTGHGAKDHVHAVGSVPGVTSPEIPIVGEAAAEASYAVIRLVGGNQYQVAGPYPTQAPADEEAKRFSKHDHANAEYVVRHGTRAVALYKNGRSVPVPDWARENPTTKETPAAKDAGDCGCAPEIAIVRPESYEACLARAAAIGPITTTHKVYELIGPDMAREEQETFVVIPLDARYQLRGGVFKLHKGARASVGVSTSEILKAVLLASADRFIVAHNHPSGKATPSQADRALTKEIAKGTRTLQDVTFLDHVVIGRKEFFSIHEDKLYRVK